MQTLHLFVEGCVQNVGFRHFVMKHALDLGLSGWVRNLTDGRVEVAAKGTDEALVAFERVLYQGSLFSTVTQIKMEPMTDAIPAIIDGTFERLPTAGI